MDLATWGLGLQGLGYATSILGAYGQAKPTASTFATSKSWATGRRG